MIATGLFNIYAILFGILGIIATLTFDAPLGPFFATLDERLDDGPLGQRREMHDVRSDHRDRLLLQGHDRIGRRRGRGRR